MMNPFPLSATKWLVLLLFGIFCCFPTGSAQAQSIGQLLIEHVPIPQKRPDAPIATAPERKQFAPPAAVAVIRGNLKDGLNAIKDRNANRALGIHAGLKPGSLDRKILAWAISLSGLPEIGPGRIDSLKAEFDNWPGKKAVERNRERAIVRQTSSASELVSAFGNTSPTSVEGAAALAGAWIALGKKNRANAVIAPWWRNETLTRDTEKLVLKKAGSALTRSDHRHRMHALFYNDRITAAQRVQSAAEQVSLAKARAATIRVTDNAAKLIKAVAPSSKKDAGYLFARIEYARRTEAFDRAAKLLLKAPRDPKILIDPGEWWVERRIVSRNMIEAGKPKLAYRLVAEHVTTEPKDILDAEFHAGWYALRFLKNAGLARKHFERFLGVASRPISLARGHYWMGRASSGTQKREHMQQAARYTGTFYGQLAAVENGLRKLPVRKAKPDAGERSRFERREIVRAIKRLEETGFEWRAGALYRHFARTVDNPGELALLAARAERNGNFNLSLQVGKIAFDRGLDVPTLSWPIGAIPSSARIGDTGRALAYSIARQESAFDKTAVSGANARGLLQLLPGTAKAVAKRNQLNYSFKKLTRDAGYNATLGAAYLSEQLEEFDNSYILTFAAYNAGPGRVAEWLERFGDPRGRKLYGVVDWIEQIPFTETRNYVQRVMENYQVYKRRISNARLTIDRDLRLGRR